ncbi:hypothetical protein A2693_01880 [Candidatus Curtissbacteria bacterium RIFCSPHIGHO2_01_FULL_40_12]|uniref:Aminoglycoside phosphotransferase domain-containing protein n=1 Tax=Candidatus Curtissbacteria bacterium RIFCSPHIGHO2_01_FULL_40_12 TaxID=1797710 RepID=A0A1F5GC05_9BACT|nr:MAG: hypothetical protein A2693_01880 [Candidatus Curtissbacteria bacterium RIFCSPHIGHO2_01_FULL_40_12]
MNSKNPVPAFKIRISGKILDYRIGKKVDLKEVENFFSKNFQVQKIWSGGRHVLGYLEKGGKRLFLKLSTSEGIGAVTKNEYRWNELFNSYVKSSKFFVPKNFSCGFYQNLFYHICERFEGNLLVKEPKAHQPAGELLDNLESVVEFPQLVQSLKLKAFNPFFDSFNFRDHFVNKSNGWLKAIPKDVAEKYNLENLQGIVNGGSKLLFAKTRHGDFTPWHIFQLKNERLGLIDGEHAMANGVENYDICYFIQRIFSVLKEPSLAQKTLNLLLKRGYSPKKLKIVLCARAIGGFLDEYLAPNPDYSYADKFKKWVLSS